MKLDINKEEYLTLVHLLEIGETIITGRELPNDPHPETQHYKDLHQKVLSYAEEMGYENDIQLHIDQYYISREMEENLEEYIHAHDDEQFWFHLTARLSQRDAIEIHGAEKIKNMTTNEFIKTTFPLEEKYDNEFAEHGIKRLRIVE